MKLILIFIVLLGIPYFSFAQEFKIKVGKKEYSADKIPENVKFPERVNKFLIKKDKKDTVSNSYTVQIGEEEHQFQTDGSYHTIEFSHDIRGLVIYILDEKRNKKGKTFILNKP
jgi:hypothetical protein